MENQEVFQFGTKLIPDKGWEYRGVYDVGNTVAHRKDLINQVPTMTQPQDTTTNKIRYERQIFDFNGNNILQEYFDNKGQLLEIDGVATVVRAWDFNGEKTLEETYDKDKKLIDKDGFARYTAVYKSKGNPISENWYGKNGEYANNKSGYARIHSIYDEQGRLTKKLFYDKDSKLVGGKWGVATYTYSYNPDCIRFYESQLFAKDEEGDEDPNKEQSRTEWKLGKYRLCLAEEIHTDKEGKPTGDEKKIYKKAKNLQHKGFLSLRRKLPPR
ncbi:MAG: hypothetical protein IPQ05_11890 [Leptospiraceae bacterium]|nr:hypothetical protein [Leptospiraceae bacterium]